MVDLWLFLIVGLLVLALLALSLRNKPPERFRTPEEARAIATRLERAWAESESPEATNADLVAFGLPEDRAAYFVAIIQSVVFRVAMERGPMPRAWEDADRHRFANPDEEFDSWVYKALLYRLRERIPDTRPPEELPPPPPRLSLGERLGPLALYFALVILPLMVVLLLWWRQYSRA